MSESTDTNTKSLKLAENKTLFTADQMREEMFECDDYDELRSDFTLLIESPPEPLVHTYDPPTNIKRQKLVKPVMKFTWKDVDIFFARLKEARLAWAKDIYKHQVNTDAYQFQRLQDIDHRSGKRTVAQLRQEEDEGLRANRRRRYVTPYISNPTSVGPPRRRRRTEQPANQAANQPANQAANQPANQAANQPANQAANQPANQAANQPSTPSRSRRRPHQPYPKNIREPSSHTDLPFDIPPARASSSSSSSSSSSLSSFSSNHNVGGSQSLMAIDE